MKTILQSTIAVILVLISFESISQQMPTFQLNSVQKVRRATTEISYVKADGKKNKVVKDTSKKGKDGKKKTTKVKYQRPKQLKQVHDPIFFPNPPTKKDSVQFAPNTYQTINVIDWAHLLSIQEDINNDIIKHKTLLRSRSHYGNLKDQLSTKNDIKILEDSAQRNQVRVDSAYFKYVREFIAYRSSVFGFGINRSKAFFDVMYNGNGKTINSLSSAGIGFGKNIASIFSELVSGNLGLVRASIGTMITGNNNDDKEEANAEEAYQKLATYGGNTVLQIEYPILYAHSAGKVNSFVMLRSLTRGAADIPVFGTTSDKWAGNMATGLDLYLDTRSDNGAIGFFANMNFNVIVGTDTFRENLNIDKKFILMSQLSAGIVISDKLKISFNILTLSNVASLRNKNVIAGGQVLK